MTDTRAKSEAFARWGKRGIIRKHKSASSQAERDQAQAALDVAKADRERIKAEIDAWLKAQPHYQALRSQLSEAHKRIESNQGHTHYERYAVGKDLGYAFEVCGSGDTWEAAFSAADQKER